MFSPFWHNNTVQPFDNIAERAEINPIHGNIAFDKPPFTPSHYDGRRTKPRARSFGREKRDTLHLTFDQVKCAFVFRNISMIDRSGKLLTAECPWLRGS